MSGIQKLLPCIVKSNITLLVGESKNVRIFICLRNHKKNDNPTIFMAEAKPDAIQYFETFLLTELDLIYHFSI